MILTFLTLTLLVHTVMVAPEERTTIMIKPDGVQRGLVGEIFKRFENKGFKLVALKFVMATKKVIEEHYEELSQEGFYPLLIDYMLSGPVIPMVWEGPNIIKIGRDMVGSQSQNYSIPGTIRCDLRTTGFGNVIHAADSVEAVNKEIALWFNENELITWAPEKVNWVYEYVYIEK